jgi:regulatory protein
MSDSQAKIIRHKITRLLSRREQSLHELRQKLLTPAPNKKAFRPHKLKGKAKSTLNDSLNDKEREEEHLFNEGDLEDQHSLGFDAATVEEVLKKFVDKDIQSDERYAEMVVRGAYRKGKGPSFVRRTLNEHDIDYSIVSLLLQSQDFDWYELAKTVREKRFGELGPEDWTAKQKQMRFLQYRGFDQDQINYAFESL